MPFQKGYKWSQKQREKCGNSSKGRIPWNKGTKDVFKHSEETKNKIRLANTGNKYNLGKKASEETKKKMSLAQSNNKNAMWKGDSVGYFGLHCWIRRNFKSPRECQFCGTKDSYNYQWANLDGKYTRDREKWALLCGKCHKNHDNKRGKQQIFKKLNEIRNK